MNALWWWSWICYGFLLSRTFFLATVPLCFSGSQLLFLWLLKVLGETFDWDLTVYKWTDWIMQFSPMRDSILFYVSQFLPRWRCRKARDALLQRSMASSGSTSPFSFISFPIQLPVRKVKSGKLWCTVPLTQDRTSGSVVLWLEGHLKRTLNLARQWLPNCDHLPLGGGRVQLPHAADVPCPLELLRVDEEDGLLDLSKDLVLQREHPGIQRHSTSGWRLKKVNQIKITSHFENLGFSLQLQSYWHIRGFLFVCFDFILEFNFFTQAFNHSRSTEGMSHGCYLAQIHGILATKTTRTGRVTE